MKFECPNCGGKMKYLKLDDLYECKSCGNQYEEASLYPGDDDSMPSGCAACGNPNYPDCLDACDRD